MWNMPGNQRYQPLNQEMSEEQMAAFQKSAIAAAHRLEARETAADRIAVMEAEIRWLKEQVAELKKLV